MPWPSQSQAFSLGLRSVSPATIRPAKSVATVIADGKRVGKHQRNWGFNLPVAVCMPVATKRRNEAVREAVIRFPVRRSFRASAFQSIPLEWLLTNTFFMQSYGATRDSLKQHSFLPQIESRRSKRFCLCQSGLTNSVAETCSNMLQTSMLHSITWPQPGKLTRPGRHSQRCAERKVLRNGTERG